MIYRKNHNPLNLYSGYLSFHEENLIKIIWQKIEVKKCFCFLIINYMSSWQTNGLENSYTLNPEVSYDHRRCEAIDLNQDSSR